MSPSNQTLATTRSDDTHKTLALRARTTTYRGRLTLMQSCGDRFGACARRGWPGAGRREGGKEGGNAMGERKEKRGRGGKAPLNGPPVPPKERRGLCGGGRERP